jgi:hypothetical protein
MPGGAFPLHAAGAPRQITAPQYSYMIPRPGLEEMEYPAGTLPDFPDRVADLGGNGRPKEGILQRVEGLAQAYSPTQLLWYNLSADGPNRAAGGGGTAAGLVVRRKSPW